MKRAWASFAFLAAAAGSALAPFGCSSSPPPAPKPTGTAQSLRDPQTCEPCHDAHYTDWSRSMHAYASEDPIFLAMNARGQRETNGALGTFCVQCHAPLAVRDGLTKDGLNLAQLPPAEKGVTCFFCHSIDSVGQSHVNADVHIADDLVMRGEIKAPVANGVHASTYSPLHDDEQTESAQACGSCHDILSPQGGHIERTFQEWQGSIFSTSTTCAANGNCHMASTSTKVSVALNGPPRAYHPHDFPAVDIAFDPNFPALTNPQAQIESTLSTVLQGALCVNALGGVRVFLDAAGVAHFWPSGASQDRRAWAEVDAYSGDGPAFYQSGAIAPGTPGAPADPDLWVLRDQMFDTNDQPVDMFWQAACAAGNELQVISSTDPMNATNYTHRERLYPLTANPGDSRLAQMPDRVTLTMHLQAVGLDVLNDLVKSGDLDPSVPGQMPTLTVALPNPTADGGVATSLEWTAATAKGGYVDVPTGAPMSCVTTLNFNVAPTQFAANPPTSCPGQAVPDAGAP